MISAIYAIDARIREGGAYAPRWGWHDDHRHSDGTPAYLPALQQVRAEFAALLDAIEGAGANSGSCLQLGLGECEASHDVWQSLFWGRAVTLDRGKCIAGSTVRIPGGDTHEKPLRDFAESFAPYSLLFIDAGHSLDDVARDHADYGPMVLAGGIIAFHDALPRKGYEEVEVWRYLDTLGPGVRRVGAEVGTAWIVQD